MMRTRALIAGSLSSARLRVRIRIGNFAHCACGKEEKDGQRCRGKKADDAFQRLGQRSVPLEFDGEGLIGKELGAGKAGNQGPSSRVGWFRDGGGNPPFRRNRE